MVTGETGELILSIVHHFFPIFRSRVKDKIYTDILCITSFRFYLGVDAHSSWFGLLHSKNSPKGGHCLSKFPHRRQDTPHLLGRESSRFLFFLAQSFLRFSFKQWQIASSVPVPPILPDIERDPDSTQIAQLCCLLHNPLHTAYTEVIVTPVASVPVISIVTLLCTKQCTTLT